jgi:hypothetical protein
MCVCVCVCVQAEIASLLAAIEDMSPQHNVLAAAAHHAESAAGYQDAAVTLQAAIGRRLADAQASAWVCVLGGACVCVCVCAESAAGYQDATITL